MKLLRLPLVCTALWLTLPLGAQLFGKTMDQTSLQIIPPDVLGFPLSLNHGPVMSGDATVAIHVDRNGQLTDCLVTGYSRPEFADTAVAALQSARFDPARVNGVPWSSVQEVHFDFSRSGVVISVSGFDLVANLVDEVARGKFAHRLHTARELDRIPAPVHVVAPVAPALGAGERRRTVAVDFYIDEEGRVRLPSVARADVGTGCAASALDAVRQWRFEPPLYRGRPTLVAVRQQFDFVAKL